MMSNHASETPRTPSLGELFGSTVSATPNVRVCDLTTHSSRVVKGGLFLACRGYEHHGLEYLDQALQREPAAVAWEPCEGLGEPDLPIAVAGVRVDGLADQVGDIANRFFARPSDCLHVTGITGTNGKTTTAWLVSNALLLLGRSAAYMGTLGYGFGDALTGSMLTTPACVTMHRRLRQLADQGADCVVMEASSHGLDQGRVDGVRIQTAAFTNLSRDHLDYHGNLQNYAQAKARLFKQRGLENAVVNVNDRHGAMFAAQLDAEVNLISVVLQNASDQPLDGGFAGLQRPLTRDAELIGTLVEVGSAGLSLNLSGAFGDAVLHSPMWGRFNAENQLVATGILLAHGYGLHEAVDALSQCTPPAGRMQVIRATDRPTAIVDFAHTPDALQKALRSARDHSHGKLWLVFGCGGDRDQGKRPAMGAVASRYADHVVLTNDNPRGERPEQIIEDVLTGMNNAVNVRTEMDRRSAIQFALAEAASEDVVLIAGKGSEAHQIVGDSKIPFSDIGVVTDFLREQSS